MKMGEKASVRCRCRILRMSGDDIFLFRRCCLRFCWTTEWTSDWYSEAVEGAELGTNSSKGALMKERSIGSCFTLSHSRLARKITSATAPLWLLALSTSFGNTPKEARMTSSISDSEIESIERVRANSFAANTIRNNKLHWRAFVKWLKTRGVQLSLPIDPELVALYLVEIADRYSFSYTSNATKGITYEHRQAKCLSPTTSAIVKEVMAGLYRTLGGRQQQAKPLFAADVEAIRRTAFIARPSAKRNMSEGGYEKPYVALRRGKLDIAITCTMFEGLLRVGEAEELRWRDITYAKDGSGVALIRYSKNGPRGRGRLRVALSGHHE